MITNCLTLLFACAAVRLAATPFDVKTFGATGDGHTLDTNAINRAIDAAAAAGGGTVLFPSGEYLCYSIHLKSRVTLHLDAGAMIVAAEPSTDLSVGYDAPEPTAGPPGTDQWQDFGHSHWHNSLIWGEDLTDISITGPGIIYGKGLNRGSTRMPEESAFGIKPATRETGAKIKPGPFGYPGHDTLPSGVGNKAIALKNCRNVIFRDFTIYHGGHFGILATGVDNLTLDNLKIDTNRDGIDIDCCQNVRVSNCSINSPNDDGICLKSSFALGYPRATENVTITNCQVSGYDEGTFLAGSRKRCDGVASGRRPIGRIKFGTESNCGFRNITISNCVFEYCRGLALESVDGALMEDITVSNLTMRDICNAPIYIRLGTRLRGPGAKVGTAKRIKFDNIVAHNVAAEAGILLAGDPTAAIEDCSLSNIFIDYEGGGTTKDANREVPVYEGNHRYPEPSFLGKLSSWGLFARHMKNLTVDRVEFRVAKEDLRPVVWLEHVTDVSFDHVKLPHAANTPTFVLKDVSGFTVHNSPGLPEVAAPFKITDEKL